MPKSNKDLKKYKIARDLLSKDTIKYSKLIWIHYEILALIKSNDFDFVDNEHKNHKELKDEILSTIDYGIDTDNWEISKDTTKIYIQILSNILNISDSLQSEFLQILKECNNIPLYGRYNVGIYMQTVSLEHHEFYDETWEFDINVDNQCVEKIIRNSCEYIIGQAPKSDTYDNRLYYWYFNVDTNKWERICIMIGKDPSGSLCGFSGNIWICAHTGEYTEKSLGGNILTFKYL